MNHNFKYLFQATFKDGTTLQQTQEDISPTTVGKNCFHDVLQRIGEVTQFVLIEQVDVQPRRFVGVELESGLFMVGETSIRLHDPNVELKDFELVYWRRVTHHKNPNQEGAEWEGPQSFIIGWQATATNRIKADNTLEDVDGYRIQRIMEVY
jgi:hypothetical protein